MKIEQIQEGMEVDVIPQHTDGFHEFTGTVVEVKENTVVVRDQDDDCFEVEPWQCE